MKQQRPVNLDISTIKLPITAYASITHRITGVILVAGVAVLLYLLDLSLSSPEGFARAQVLLDNELLRLLLWAILAAVIYHSAAGVRHLAMDLGMGESLEGGTRSARIVFGVTAVLVVLAGVWIW